MKVILNPPEKIGGTFVLQLFPETEDERVDLMMMVGTTYSLKHTGFQYMDPSFNFCGYKPSND